MLQNSQLLLGPAHPEPRSQAPPALLSLSVDPSTVEGFSGHGCPPVAGTGCVAHVLDQVGRYLWPQALMLGCVASCPAPGQGVPGGTAVPSLDLTSRVHLLQHLLCPETLPFQGTGS